MGKVARWGTGLPVRTALPGAPTLSFAQPELTPAVGHALRAAPRNLKALPKAARGLPPRDVLRWLLLAESFAFHEVERTIAWCGVELPPSRPAVRPSAPVSPQPVTGLIIAQDEADRIADAITSLRPFVEEIIVVDGGSRDETVEIARGLGVRVLSREFDRFDHQRNAGLDLVTTPWVLGLDCDERMVASSLELVRRATATACEVVMLNILNFVGDDPEPTHWPTRNPRLHRSHLRFNGSVHESTPLRSVLHLPLSINPIYHWKPAANSLRNHIRYLKVLDPSNGQIEQLEAELAAMPEDGNRNVPERFWRD